MDRTNLNSKTKHLLVAAVFVILFFAAMVPQASGKSFLDVANNMINSLYGSPGVGPLTTEWQSVTPEEIQMCTLYGGSGNAQVSAGTATGTIALSQLTLTLQGSRTILPDKNLYEIGWYIEPVSGAVNYDIYAINISDAKEIKLTSGSASIGGSSGYNAFYEESNYSHIKMVHSEGTIQVPIVKIS